MQVEEIRELQRLVAAATGCVGPCGRARTIWSGDVAGARLFVTSSSAAVLRSWPVAREHNVVKLVVDKVEAHLRRYHDCGWLFLNFCIRATFALKGVPISGGFETIPQHSRTAALHGLALSSAWICEILSCEPCSCRHRLEWSNLGDVLALLRSTLCKSVAVQSAGELRHLSVTILDAFLSSLNETCAAVDSLRYSWFCGPEVSWSHAFRGLVLDTPASIAALPNGSNHRLILFDVSLEQWLPGGSKVASLGIEQYSLEAAPGVEGSQALRKWEMAQFRKFGDELLAAGVGILACQKLVDPWLVDYLKQRGVSVLSRLSLRHIEHVRRLSGAIPVTSLASLPKAWSDVWGWVGHLEKRVIHERSYTFLHAPSCAAPGGSNGCTVCTLLIGASDSYALDELKQCVPQAVAALQEVAQSGFVLSGAGLTEVFLADALVERAKAQILQRKDEAACRAILTIADCLSSSAACLAAEKNNVVGRMDFLQLVRTALEDSTPTYKVLEAESSKKYALLGAMDLAGILVRLGDTLDLARISFG